MSMQATDMGPSHSGTSQPARDRSGWLHHAVPVAMLIVATAMGVAGHLHLGLQPEFAAAVGLSLFCLMLVCHLLLRAADDVDRAAEEAAEQRVKQVSSPIPTPAMPPAPKIPHAPVQPTVAATNKAASDHVAAPLVREPLPRELQAGPAPAARDATALPDRSTAPAGWTFRPVDIQLPMVTAAGSPAPDIKPPALGALGPTIAEDVPTPADGRAPHAAQSERIDAILKRLAVQIRSGTQPQAPAPEAAEAPVIADVEPVPAVATPPPPLPAPVPAMAAPGLTVVAPAHELPEAALASAVDALRSTVEAMRASPGLASAPSPSPAEVRLAVVAQALAAERANVFLEPILALSEDQARHFEVSVRLVSDAGEDLDARAIATDARGAGLLAVLDALGLRHAAGFALKLERRGREGTVFSTVAGQSLASDTFVSDAAGRHAQGIANRLVLTFAQHEMRGLGPAQIAALSELGQLGFRFALSSVADLDMDFEALRSLGFQFVKLDAGVFLQGLHCAGAEIGAEIPAADICHHFEDLGLQVIVSGIDDATLRQRVEGCGVTFGQGLLFGEPRPIPVSAASGSIAA